MDINILKELTILYAEDEEILQRTVKNSLGPLCKNILTANNGKEALEIFQEKGSEIDLIVTDINMPYMNGLKMCENIREIDKEIPIIITTAYNDISFLHKAIELGVSNFVLKPIMMPKLVEVIQTSVEPKVLSRKLEIEQKINEEEKIKNAKLLAIKKLTSGITHELNTPLTFIKGALEIVNYDVMDIQQNDKIKKSILDNLTQASSGLKRIENIVNTMKDLYDDNQIEEKTRVNIYSTLIDAVILVYSKVKHLSRVYINGDLFDLELPRDKFKFFANVQKHRIKHLWILLLNNALDELSKIEEFSQREINIQISENKHHIIVQIKDNAGGISEDIIDHLFEPFKGTKPSSGMGIGLTIAKKIVEENNSYIIGKNYDNGAIFEVGITKSE